MARAALNTRAPRPFFAALLAASLLGGAGCASTLDGFERSLERAGVARFGGEGATGGPGLAVAVRADLSLGTPAGRGAVVGPGAVLTVAHVVGDAAEAWVATRPGGGWVKARVVRTIPAEPEPLVLLELELDSGWYGALLGFRGFRERDSYRTSVTGDPALLATARGAVGWEGARLQPGDSGSPVLDAHGDLVGLLSGRRGGAGVYAPLPGSGPVLVASLRR